MSGVGRNDPCPCGSGLKYKKCCLGKTESTRPLYTPEERARVLTRLMRFAARREFEQDHRIAQVAFWGDSLADRPDEDAQRALTLPTVEAVYEAWFVFDVPIEDGRTLTDLFLEREATGLGPGERAYLDRMRASHMRLYEVTDVSPDEGLHFTDLWTDERVWVRERLATRQIVRWDLVAARVVQGPDGSSVIDGGLYLYPPEAREALLKDLRRAHRLFVRRCPDDDVGDFFKRATVLFHRAWLDWTVFPPEPALVTAEGDPIVLARAVFDVRDRPALLRMLDGHPDLIDQGDGSYAWLESLPSRRMPVEDPAAGRPRTAEADPERMSEARRGLGAFVVKGERLVLETVSRERAERGRRFLEEWAGEAVRYRTTRYEDVKAALQASRRSRTPPRSDVPPDVEAEVVGEFYERHYRDWPDTPVPALGNRTPRQAARLKTVRPRLVALLKDFENRSERMRREGRPAYDFGWIWQELGLERP
ncbi:MAG: SEC-C metal-binding domain-containing protein [Armatimonadota bacterium]|nr:SEC-C metal-binding domain-containing protein [Armatimonadota bacterium]